MRFGRQPHDKARHAALPKLPKFGIEVPAEVNWLQRIPHDAWGMYANDTLGDCTCAAVAHLLMLWESYNPPIQAMTDANVIRLYEDFGYRPSDPATDQGAMCIDVLEWWHQRGVPVLNSTNELYAFRRIDPRDNAQVREAIYLFGAVYTGILLSQDQINDPVWEPDPNADEGHCVPVGAFDENTLTCVTWGATQPMTWDFWNSQVEEAYAPLSLKWLTTKLLDPSGITLDQLVATLKTI